MTSGVRIDWTEEKLRTLIAGRKAGKTRVALAKEFGVSLSTIKARLQVLRANQWEPASCRRPRIEWTDERDESLLDGYQNGETLAALSREVGISVSSIKRRLQLLREGANPESRASPRAPEKLEAELVVPRKKARRCLVCGRDFPSCDWSNRICRSCKRNVDRSESVHGLPEHYITL